MIEFVKKYLNSTNIILLFILILGLFFRIYKLEIFYPWGHDQDLFSMIVKDIVVDHHLRLIGQQTTILGVFIGPLFYYLMVLSFAIFHMDPLSSAIPITIIAVLTIFSFYCVFDKFFGSKAGLMGAFLYAVSPGMVFFSRWAVPTQPTTLWSVWFLYALLGTLKGRVPIILISALVGLVWHIHVALMPLLLLLPISFWLSKKSGNKMEISKKSIVISFLMFSFLMFPFFAFEVRHNFQQIKAISKATYEEKGEASGINRLYKTINLGGRSLAGAFFLSNATVGLDSSLTAILPFLLLGAILSLFSEKRLTKNQTILLIVWIILVFSGQLFSKTQISEHYFGSITAILFLAMALILSKLRFTIILLAIYLIGITVWLINKPNDFGGYIYKKQTIEYIKNNSLEKGYPCVAMNFIENNIDKGNGFRYLSWFYKLKVITGGNDVPVYNIVTPWTISENEINAKFGMFGVILPHQEIVDPSTCSNPKRQLLPLWGFTN